MRVDRSRAAVYAAELAAFDGTAHESLVPFDELVELATTVTAASWWPRGPVEVLPARSDAESSTTRQRGSGRPVIRIAAPQSTPATIVHELAHVLAGLGDGHGPGFRRAHVDLAGLVFGQIEAGWLLDAYAAMGLVPGARAWPAPPLRRAAGGAIAL